MLAKRLLIQVVPRLDPGRCGITDHAVALAYELRNVFGIESAFVVLNSSHRCSVPFPVVHCAPGELLQNCIALSEGQSAAVLAHVSGYGYSPDGVPALLASALARVKAGGELPLAVYFHELFASGPPWKSAFWHSRRQQTEIRNIAGLCDLILTNTRRYADWLERQFSNSSAPPMKRMPVFSTVGEAQVPGPFSGREPAIAVFGLPGTRRLAYKQLTRIGPTLEQLGVRRIFDIGPEFAAPSEVNGIAVSPLGQLSIADLARTLSSCGFGFMPHPPWCMAKSSIFAGYCAQGVIPVIAEPFRGELDGLTDGIHVVSPATVEAANASGWEKCSRAAWNWHMTHSLRVHAEQYANWMGRSA